MSKNFVKDYTSREDILNDHLTDANEYNLETLEQAGFDIKQFARQNPGSKLAEQLREQPTTLDIMGITFTIKEQEEIYYEGVACNGLCKPDQATILLKSDLPKSVKQMVLWHEIMHATLYLSGFENLYENEQLCNLLAISINSILDQEKDFI